MSSNLLPTNLRGTAFILVCNLNPIELSGWDSLGFHWTWISAALTSDPHFRLPPCFIHTVSRPQITHMRDLHLSFPMTSAPCCTGLHADCISPWVWASLWPQAVKSQFTKLHKDRPMLLPSPPFTSSYIFFFLGGGISKLQPLAYKYGNIISEFETHMDIEMFHLYFVLDTVTLLRFQSQQHGFD